MASLPQNMYTSSNRKSESWLQVCFLWDDYMNSKMVEIKPAERTSGEQEASSVTAQPRLCTVDTTLSLYKLYSCSNNTF